MDMTRQPAYATLAFVTLLIDISTVTTERSMASMYQLIYIYPLDKYMSSLARVSFNLNRPFTLGILFFREEQCRT